MEGCNDNKETINSVITKLYRKAEFDLAKAQRGIIFLDGMDKIGNNANISELGRRQVKTNFSHVWNVILRSQNHFHLRSQIGPYFF